MASSSGTGHDAAANGPSCTCSGHARAGERAVFDRSRCPLHGPMPELPVAAPDPTETRDPFADDVLERLLRSDAQYQQTHGHYIVPLSERLLAVRAERAALLAERQQDKERTERLTEVGKAAQIVAELNGESRATYGRVVTHIEWVNAMFRLETAVLAARAALAVEEDAP